MLSLSKPAVSLRPASFPRSVRALLAIAVLAALVVLGGSPAAAASSGPGERGPSRSPLTRSEVVIRNAGVELRGLVVAPRGARNHPGVVLVHGAGPRTRDDLMREAEEFARRGVVALVHDKRTEGYSLTERSFDDLAADELAALRVLRARPEVDPGRVGLWGFSEGGWVVPLVASRSAEARFLITVGAGGYAPEREQVWSNAEYLAHAGVTGRPLRRLSEGLTRVLVAGGMFGAAGYDTVPALRRVRQPVLAVWGARERTAPPAESARVFRNAIAGDGAGLTVRFVARADHDLRRSPDGFTSGPLVTSAFDTMADWVHATTGPPSGDTAPGGADPAGAGIGGVAPVQERVSRALPPVGWAESPWTQLGALTVLLLTFAAQLTVPLFRRATARGPSDARRAGDRGTRRLVRASALAGLGAVLGAVGYLGYLTVTGAQAPGAVALGRPVFWLVTQLLAVGAIAGAGVALAQARALRRTPGYLTLLGVTAVFILWAAYWGLLSP